MVLMAVCFPIGIIVTLIIVEHIWDVSVVNVRQLLVLTLFLPCTLFAITLLIIKIIYYKSDWLGNLLQKEIPLRIRKEKYLDEDWPVDPVDYLKESDN